MVEDEEEGVRRGVGPCVVEAPGLSELPRNVPRVRDRRTEPGLAAKVNPDPCRSALSRSSGGNKSDGASILGPAVSYFLVPEHILILLCAFRVSERALQSAQRCRRDDEDVCAK